MSLTPKISATELKNSFVVYDCTGQYSSSNKGGYGVYNPGMEHVLDAYFLIWKPGMKKDEEPYKIVVYPDMPNKEGLAYEILPYKLGMKEIESGEYRIKYVVSGSKNGVTFEKSIIISVVFINSIKCCIDKLTTKLGPDSFKDEKQRKIIELSNLLESVCAQIECGLNGKANENIEYMKAQCKCSGC